MFIKKLYQHSKLLFIAFMGFVTAFMVINYKWGIVATPFLQYGMYSKPVHIKDTLELYVLKVNNTDINWGGLSFSDKDKLQLFLKRYAIQQLVNEEVYTTMGRYLPVTAGNYHNKLSDTIFTSWYKQLVAQIIKAPVVSLAVYRQRLQWEPSGFKNIDSTAKITGIVP